MGLVGTKRPVVLIVEDEFLLRMEAVDMIASAGFAAIDALHQSPAPDLLMVQRLKKRKLQLRDRIAFIEDQITPDIIA